MIRQSVIAAVLVLAPPAYARDITGDWTGRYICNQGITALHLVIQRASKPGVIIATFNFGPAPENRLVPKGAYTMHGNYDQKARRVTLTGDRWIKQPAGYVMVDLDGRVDAAVDKIAGMIPSMPGCSSFEVRRTSPLVG